MLQGTQLVSCRKDRNAGLRVPLPTINPDTGLPRGLQRKTPNHSVNSRNGTEVDASSNVDLIPQKDKSCRITYSQRGYVFYLNKSTKISGIPP